MNPKALKNADARAAVNGTPDDPKFAGLMSEQIVIFVLSQARTGPIRDKILKYLKFLEPSDLTGPGPILTLLTIKELMEANDGEIPSIHFLVQTIKEATRSGKKDDEAYNLNAPDIYDLLARATKADGRDAGLVKRDLDKFLSDCVWARFHRAFLEARKNRAYDLIPALYEEARLDLGDDLDTSQDVFKDIDDVLTESVIAHVKIPFPTIRQMLNGGGPALGEYLLIQGATGQGKSVVLANFAVHLSTHGYKVLILTMENDERLTKQRCLAIHTGIPVADLIARETEVRTEAAKQLFPNGDKGEHSNLRVEWWTPNAYNTNHIKDLLKQLSVRHGFEPEILIVDYLEKLEPLVKQKDKYNKFGEVSQNLATLAGETRKLVISATQSSREGKKTSQQGMEHTGDSWIKNQHASYILVLNQSRDERNPDPSNLLPGVSYHKDRSFFRLTVAKNRNGPEHEGILCQYDKPTMRMREV